jgi:hypothetical protein
MKEIYTQHTLNEFFEEFKSLPISYKIEQVHQLLNNPDAKAMHKVHSHFKHLKLIIMTSAFIIAMTALLFFNTPVKRVKKDTSHRISEQTKFSETKKNKFNTENISDSFEAKIEKAPTQGANTKKEHLNTFAENSLNTNSQIREIQSDRTGNEQAYNKKEIKENPSKSVGIHETEIPTIEVPILKLSKSEMENLGFVFYKDSVVFMFNDNCNKYISVIDSFILDLTIDSAKIIDEKYLTLKQFENMKSKGTNQFTIKHSLTTTQVCGKISLNDNSQILIRALTNYNSSQFTEQIWRYIEDSKGGYYPEMTINDLNMNLLVPIKCCSKDSGLEAMFNKHVFWMYPNDELFLKLPKTLSKELQQEFNMLSSEKSPDVKVESSCTYYEVCKSTLKLNNFKLYPNPAKYSATVEFDISGEAKGSVSIVNIAGARLKTLIPNSPFHSGHNSFQMDLSGITPGIYLISINTDKGFKTQRIIIS